jgi:hypothetical protein
MEIFRDNEEKPVFILEFVGVTDFLQCSIGHKSDRRRWERCYPCFSLYESDHERHVYLNAGPLHHQGWETVVLHWNV